VTEQNPTPSEQSEPQPEEPTAQQPHAEPTAQQPHAEQPAQQPYAQPYGSQYPPQYAQQPYAQQPYAQQPYAQQPYAPAVPTNSMAIVTLIAGIAGLSVLFFVGSIVAVITGPMARKQIAQTGEQGAGMGTAGIIMGWVGIGLGVVGLIVAVLLPLFFVGLVGLSAY
jgi:hypothetical protein